MMIAVVAKFRNQTSSIVYGCKLHVCNMIGKEFLLLNYMHAEYMQSCAIVLQPS